MVDWNKPLVTFGGQRAELIDDHWEWEKDLFCKLVKIYGGGPASTDVLIPCDDEGRYIKAQSGDTSFFVRNEGATGPVEIHYVPVKIGGKLVFVSSEKVSDFPSKYHNRVYKADIEPLEMTSEEFMVFAMECLSAREKR